MELKEPTKTTHTFVPCVRCGFNFHITGAKLRSLNFPFLCAPSKLNQQKNGLEENLEEEIEDLE